MIFNYRSTQSKTKEIYLYSIGFICLITSTLIVVMRIADIDSLDERFKEAIDPYKDILLSKTKSKKHKLIRNQPKYQPVNKVRRNKFGNLQKIPAENESVEASEFKDKFGRFKV